MKMNEGHACVASYTFRGVLYSSKNELAHLILVYKLDQ